jgi:hypothetical protein
MQEKTASAGYVFGPWRDFLIFGGGSLLILPLFLLGDNQSLVAPVLIAGTALSSILNHPHFAHSYQMFYDRFMPSLKNPDIKQTLKLRYINAGLVVPFIMIAFFVFCYLRHDARLLSYAVNFMVFTVGWHYVKQGYGILIVDSVFKRAFFTAIEKRILFWNAIFCWLFSWTLFNHFVLSYAVWDIYTYQLPVPDAVSYALGVCAFISSVAALTLLAVRVRKNRKTLGGVLAYAATLYVWMFGSLHPVLMLVIPAFHSLQYLGMVWRYNINRIQKQTGAAEMNHGAGGYTRFLSFIFTGIILGYLGFWVLPEFFDSHVTYATSFFGNHMFLFMFWIFINIHHYFIDNVIWRSDNPDVKAHLFSA